MIQNLKNPTEMSGFCIVYNGATLNEVPGFFGISHLMEHLVTKGFDDLLDDFDRDCIDWNAYTSGLQIVFYMKGLEECIVKYRNKFLSAVSKFNITQKQFENEKRIVIQEYLDSFNGQYSSHYLNLMRKVYGHFNPIGFKKDIESITLDNCYQYFDLQYARPHQIVNVSKSYEFDSSIEFSDLVAQRKFSEQCNDFELINDFKGKVSVIQMSPCFTENIPEVKLIALILGDGLKSPLMQEIREKRGLTYSIGCYCTELDFSKQFFVIASQTTLDKADELQDCISEIMYNRDKYLTEERFNIVKNMMRISFKKQAINRFQNIRDFVLPKAWSLENVLEEITYERVLSAFDKHLDYNKFIKSTDCKCSKGEFLYS